MFQIFSEGYLAIKVTFLYVSPCVNFFTRAIDLSILFINPLPADAEVLARQIVMMKETKW